MAKKVKKAKVTIVTEEPKTLWQKIKNFFYNSHNVIYNAAIGAVSAIGSVFAMIDWAPLMNMIQSGTGFSRNQVFWTSGVMLAVAAGGYLTRVIGTKEVNGHLLPKAD